MDKFEKREITKKSVNFSRWYTDVILKAELADYAPVKGCMVIRPYGYAIWENIQRGLDQEIKKADVENAYFPLFIPESFLNKEKKHVEGFSPELALVTIGGGKELKEKLAIRPTSETIIYKMFSKWISSWRDLPLKINQWGNVVRWEKRTYLFLRTTEFLWQEGHTAHASHQEAKEEAGRALKMYQSFYEDVLAMPGIVGKKSKAEKFPGADDTFSFEVLMPDGKALQGCTSHDLGQNFSKPFEITFQDKGGKNQNVWQTCWGLSTRTIGGLIMMHGDDNGLVLPPKIAPIQAVIIPIYKDKKEKVLSKAKKIKEKLEENEIRVKLDDDETHSLGYKINEWELKGVPLRLEIGEKEIMERKIKVVKRQGLEPRAIYFMENKLEDKLNYLLEEIQTYLYNHAERFLQDNTYQPNSFDEFKEIAKSKKGFIKAFWCESEDCEQKIKQETKASTRCLPLDVKREKGKCVYCGKPASHKWFFAQAY